jgi:hypothetical protein
LFGAKSTPEPWEERRAYEFGIVIGRPFVVAATIVTVFCPVQALPDVFLVFNVKEGIHMICSECELIIFEEPGTRAAVRLCKFHEQLQHENAELRQTVARQALTIEEYKDKLRSVLQDGATFKERTILT